MKNNSKIESLSIISESGLNRYLREVNQIPSLSLEEEFLLTKHYLEQNDVEAARKLVASHLKLVVKIALNYKNYGLALPDLISEGNIGLMQAVKKFNPDLGYRLSTYARWWIKAAIQEYILKSWSLVKLGTTATQKKLFFTLNKVKNHLAKIYNRPVTNQDFIEIADKLNVSARDVQEMDIRLSSPDLSLNHVINKSQQDGEVEWIELLPEKRPNQEIVLAAREERANKHKLLSKAYETLNTREFEIFKARKLLENPLTLDKLSVLYGISKERVRQIENRAYEKVKNFILSNSNLLSYNNY